MNRLTYMQAVNIGRHHDVATSVDLMEARRVLKNTIEEAAAALNNVEREMQGRMAVHRAREAMDRFRSTTYDRMRLASPPDDGSIGECPYCHDEMYGYSFECDCAEEAALEAADHAIMRRKEDGHDR